MHEGNSPIYNDQPALFYLLSSSANNSSLFQTQKDEQLSDFLF